MTAVLRDASGKMHHGILFDRRLGGIKGMSPGSVDSLDKYFLI